ncbi:PepSY domain-containing protein [Micromonospora sp. WMMD1120]|uniref:PepSY domain-containing protein n=1 Tax=Micromonospora sp. WMMD1120 TaxID=3016106 RepID=UPI002416EF25|nr:PepSY domain-containing protein [Micromonospora sp. WMMD1120]MDG4810675.1 PepSY domain-containing protein [Micromonospora sp. WMMD1120]
MKRTNLLLATVGGSAVLAAAGVTLGVAAANDPRSGGTTLAAATVAPTPTDAPGASASPSASGTPSADTPSGTPSSGASSSSDAPTTGTAPAGGAVDEKRAGEIALGKAGGGQIVEVEAEQENGRQVWSVEIVAGDTEHEVDVDRENGSVVKAEQEPVDDDADDKDDDADDRDDDADDKDDDD